MGDSYFTLNEATDGVGVFPQHQKMSDAYDYDSPRSIRRLPFYAGADFEPDLQTIIIEAGAKKTDLLSSGVIVGAFLISSKFRDLLRTFNLAPHALFPAYILQEKGEKWDEYHLLHMPHLPCISGESTPGEASELISRDGKSLDMFVLHQPGRLTGTYVSPRLADDIREKRLTGIRLGRGKVRMLG